MLAQSTSVFTEGARRTKRSRFATTKAIKDESGNEEDGRWNQVRPEMIDPPAGNRWNGKHNCDDQKTPLRSATARTADSKHQRKQNRYNNISAFDLFDKRRKDEEQRREQ